MTLSASERARVRSYAVAGATGACAMLAVVLAVLAGDLRSRPVVDVRRTPLVLHGGAPVAASEEEGAAAGVPLRWRQSLAPLAADVDVVRLRVADLVGHPLHAAAAERAILRARHRAGAEWSEWQDAHGARFTVEHGEEGFLDAAFGTPLPAGAELELELLAGAGASGAKGTLSPFLRYRGPWRHLTPPSDRSWSGTVLERALEASADGLAPLTGLALAAGELDLRSGALRVSLRRADEAEWLVQAEGPRGAVFRRGHLLVPFERPLALARAEPLVLRVELPVEGTLFGDAVGPAVTGLFGDPAPRPPLGPLSLRLSSGALALADCDLAMRLGGPPSLARGLADLRAGLSPAAVAAGGLWVAAAACAAASLALARNAPRAARAEPLSSPEP